MKEEFRQMLKDVRLKTGRTLQAVADVVGVDRSTIFKWESGDREPSITALEAWGRALGLEIDIVARDPRPEGEMDLSDGQDAALRDIARLIGDIEDADARHLVNLARSFSGRE